MYWLRNDKKLATVLIPMLTIGQNFDTSLIFVTESGEALERVTLCCLNGADAGMISAKKSTGSAYHAVGGLFDTECYLGGILASSEITINFRVNFPAGTPAGLRTIPIVVLYGDKVQGPTTVWSATVDSVWRDPDDAPIWRDPREV